MELIAENKGAIGVDGSEGRSRYFWGIRTQSLELISSEIQCSLFPPSRKPNLFELMLRFIKFGHHAS
jgi:hypothetical protein